MWFGGITTGTAIWICFSAGIPLAWGDYDNDGDLDLLLVGVRPPADAVGFLCKNDGAGQFSDSGISVPGLSDGAVAWNDFDSAGFLDFVAIGNTGTNLITRVYRNVGGDGFDELDVGAAGLHHGTASWGDFDSDGDPDLLLAGSTDFPGPGTNGFAGLYRNDRGVFIAQAAPLSPVLYATSAWCDYDNDGDLDFALGGETAPTASVTTMHRNDNGSWAADDRSRLAGTRAGAIAWGDYDADNDPDLLITGSAYYIGGGGGGMGSPGWLRSSDVRRNDGTGWLGAFLQSRPISVDFSSVGWGDCDNDGDLDFMLTGDTSLGPGSRLYRNQGTNVLSVTNGLGAPGVRNGAISWADLDGDGDLDFALSGAAASGLLSRVFRNAIRAANAPPAPPRERLSPRQSLVQQLDPPQFGSDSSLRDVF